MTLTHTKIRSTLAPSLALLLATGTAALWSPAPAQAGPLSISEKDEIEAGRKVAAQARKEYGGSLPASDPMAQRVRAIGMRFAQLSSRKNIPYTYEVLKNDKVLNAFAAPGGPIFVTRKLVTTTANDAELAYVLGHETIHIDRKHIVKAVEKQQKVGLAAGILGAILGRGGSGDVIGSMGSMAVGLWARGYSRDQEIDADNGGVRWMSQLGFDPRAGVSMLGKLGGGNSGFLDKYLSTHPDPKSRQASVQRLIDAEKLLDVAKQHGGPTLGSTSSSQGGYSNSGYPSSGNGTSYPSPGNGTGYPASNGDVYPPSEGASNPSNDDYDYPAEDDATGAYPRDTGGDTAREITLSTPVVLVKQGTYQVIMVSLADMARWSGAGIASSGTATTLTRGNNSIQVRAGSTSALVNRRTVQLSAAAQVFNGKLYAPIGTLAEGVGATASFDGSARVVRLSLNGGNSGFVRLP